MRRSLLVVALLLAAFTATKAHAQNFPIQQDCTVGGVSAITQGLQSTNKLQGSWPGCLVTVYYAGTLNKAPIFSDAPGTVLSNPFTASTTNGHWILYASNAACYDVVISANPAVPGTSTMPTLSYSGVCTDSPGGSGGNGNPNPYQTFTNQTLVTFTYASYGFTGPAFSGGMCFDQFGVAMIPDKQFWTKTGTNEYNYNFGFVGPTSGACTVNVGSGGGSGGSGLYCPLTGCTLTGPLVATDIVAQIIQGIPSATSFTGPTIVEQYNAAVAALPNGCGKVFIPTGYYPFTGTIVIPRCVSLETGNPSGPPSTSLVNAVLAYSGTNPGEAILLGDGNYGTQPFPIGTLSNLTLVGPTIGPTVGSNVVGIHCGGNDPGGLFPRSGVITVTGWSVSGTTVTLIANNALTAGTTGYFEFSSGPTFLNGQNLAVLSSGLSSTQFQVTFTGGAGSGMAIGNYTPSTASNGYFSQYRTISNVQVVGFGYGLLAGDNCFNLTLQSVSMLQNYVDIGSVVNPIDSGENMLMMGGELGESTYALASIPYSWNGHAVSFDFNGGASGTFPDIYDASFNGFGGHFERQCGPFVQIGPGVGYFDMDGGEMQLDSATCSTEPYMISVQGPTYVSLSRVTTYSNHPVTTLISSDIAEISVQNLRGNANRSDGSASGYPLNGIQNVFNISTYTGIDAVVHQSQTAYGSNSIFSPQTWNSDIIYNPTTFETQTLFTNFGGSAGSMIKICDGTPLAPSPCKFFNIENGTFQLLNNAGNLPILQESDAGALGWGSGPMLSSSGIVATIGNEVGAAGVLACIKSAGPPVLLGHCSSAISGATCTCN